MIGWQGDQNHPGFARLIEDITAVLGEPPPRVRQQEEMEARWPAAEEERSTPSKALRKRNPLNLIRFTFDRAKRNWMYILPPLLAMIVAAVAGIFYQNTIVERPVTSTFVAGKMTPQEIANTYLESIVLIESEWRLIDRWSGKQVFFKNGNHNGSYLPAYVRLKGDGSIVPWLILTDELSINEAVTQRVRGTGFFVRNDGWIVTNKHIATPWAYSYYFTCECDVTSGLLFEEGDDSEAGEQRGQPFQPMNAVAKWIPPQTQILFDEKKPTRVRGAVSLQAKSEHLDVRLPGNSVPLDARVFRTGSKADVALIKIEVVDPMPPVPFADRDYKPQLGEPITVIGYPSSGKIAEAAFAAGIIADINVVHSEVDTEAEAYEILLTAASRINSGGPVVDSNGKAIGILTLMKPERSEKVAFFATSIRAARKLLD